MDSTLQAQRMVLVAAKIYHQPAAMKRAIGVEEYEYDLKLLPTEKRRGQVH